MGLLDWLRGFRLPKTLPPTKLVPTPLPATQPLGATVRFTNWQGYGYLGVVGESHHQDTLFRISRTGTHCEATLVPEPDNPFDANAVCVYIDGMVVGYLPRSHARKYQRRLLTLPEPLRCPAKLIGGTPDKPHFGVLLDHRQVEQLPAPKRTRKKIQTIDPKETPF